jgi:hypothetical protein
VFELENVGNAAATQMVGLDLERAFAFAGGAYPGPAGTCATDLAPGETCTVEVVVSADVFGPSRAVLAVEYDYGVGRRPAELELRVDRLGGTGNLVDNGDAEMLGDPPPGWIELAGDRWAASDDVLGPHSGDGHFFAFDGNDNEPVLGQAIDLSAYDEAVASNDLEVSFSAWGRSVNSSEDPFAFVVEYRSSPNAPPLAVFDTGYVTDSDWTEYVDSRVVPVGTTEIRILLRCRLDFGTFCDAFFDDVVLTLDYDG